MFKSIFARRTSTPIANTCTKHLASEARIPLPKTEAQQQVLLKIESDYQLAEQQLQRKFPRPSILFSLRGKSAGTAHLQLNKLRFNPVLLEENVDAFVTQVVPHEVSHLLCFQLFGKVKPHGKEWQQLMNGIYQIPADTTHQLDTKSVAGKQFQYHCQCGPVMLSIRRHNKVTRNQTQYRCIRCSQVITAKT
ncbi:SprT family zinc-dependent metalloprotease [Shewanella sp. 3_MG-2023]|uniref:SprT family zinc-dependent metalloprotease n=1 Tax=Shewanella sp. 3_MG-2023 TaxID=3062635 RepID=UPI0026E3147E|nr:SprT family zinc-dependent metalloprotease [Shewanella sp. 3_MG-2023]MDO6774565.1 SprT family zinc-dependent metalloprotease [Shewanella sp. 3_MG-2023]